MVGVPRIGVITEIPTPYRLPLFARLAERSDLELEVLFCASVEPGREWRDDGNLARVPHRVMRGWHPVLPARGDTFVYEINPEIVKILRRERYDALVVGGYGVFAEQAAIAYARATRTPYLLHSESHHGKKRRALTRAIKRVALPAVIAHAAAGLATGTRAADYLVSYGLPRERVRIVPNTIDVVAYASAATRVREDPAHTFERLGLPPRFLLFVGRLVETKGLLDLLAAHMHAGGDAPPLVVVGDGPLRGLVTAAPNVRWLGFRQPAELIELFALADRTVLPSLAETWGVVVNEALACGSPVVVSDAVGAAHDLLRPGIDGIVVPAGNIDALATALVRDLPSLEPGHGLIRHFDYSFAEAQFVEGVELALTQRRWRAKSSANAATLRSRS